MKRIFLWGGIVVVCVLSVAGAAYGWAAYSAGAKLAEVYTTHEVAFSVPMPLDSLEVAIERGRHLTAARYACADCHGEGFGGGVMVDDPAMGRLLGPNLTGGVGSVTREYTVADWDRIVRHGIRRDGKAALMPSEDFMAMSDRELGDVIAYIRSLPPVDNVVPASTLGPVGTILVATGRFPLSAKTIGMHDAPHRVEPPAAEESIEFGAHLATVCTGCHRQNFAGGKIVQGPPDWAPASNLTPHAEGLGGIDYPNFVRAMREGIRHDGKPLQAPMTLITPYAGNMTETELKALWLYLRSLPPVPRGI